MSVSSTSQTSQSSSDSGSQLLCSDVEPSRWSSLPSHERTSNLLPEISDYIIDFLHSDRDALRACSLVCKDWLAASRLHFLGILVIDQSNAREFVDLLNHPSSTIGKACHTIDICIEGLAIFRRIGVEVVTPLDVLADHLDKIPARSLVLRGLGWTPVDEEHEDALSRWLGRITQLTLIGPASNHPDSFYTCCPSLEALSYISYAIRPHAIEYTPATYPVHLHTIRISFEGMANIPAWLGLLPGLRPIDRLELYSRKSFHSHVSHFIRHLSELPAYNLYIGFRMDLPSIFDDSGAYWRDLDEILNRPHFAHLRRVEMDVCIDPSNVRDLYPDLPEASIRGFMPDLASRGILEVHLIAQKFSISMAPNSDVYPFDRITRYL